MTTPSTPTPSTQSAATPSAATPTAATTPPPPPAGPPTAPPSAPGSPPAPESDGPPTSRSLVALAAAAVVVVVTVGLVLVFGLARPPAVPSLAEEPEPTLVAEVAWVHWGDREACLEVATLDGATREVACGLRGEEVLGWEADGIAMLVWERTEAIEVIDPDTGEVVDVRSFRGDPWEEREREWSRVDTRNRDGVLTVRLDGTVLWEVEAPEAYWVNPGSVSPDGRFVVAFDSADRLLLFDATGERAPRVWLEDVEGWQAPVWEGTPIPVADQG